MVLGLRASARTHGVAGGGVGVVRDPASHKGKPCHSDERRVSVYACGPAQRPPGRRSEYVEQGLRLDGLRDGQARERADGSAGAPMGSAGVVEGLSHAVWASDVGRRGGADGETWADTWAVMCKSTCFGRVDWNRPSRTKRNSPVG